VKWPRKGYKQSQKVYFKGVNMLPKISIQEDNELKNILDCKEITIRNWLREKSWYYSIDLICLLLKELKNEKDNRTKETD